MNYSLPKSARLPINRCNLPAVILGSLSFQHHPASILIDGIDVLHKTLFNKLNTLPKQEKRAEYFKDYMTVRFRMHKLEDAGLEQGDINKRVNADYLRMLRGWLFNPNGKEAAVLKAWTESRFGLLTRYHKSNLTDYSTEDYQVFLSDMSQGLYATNALEAQLDLLYSYCQYELAQLYERNQTLHLYRGVNKIESYEILNDLKHTTVDKNKIIVLLNNLNSFSSDQERACEFGDYIMEADIPWQKVLFYSDLLPGMFSTEKEVLVIGGVYQVVINS